MGSGVGGWGGIFGLRFDGELVGGMWGREGGGLWLEMLEWRSS